MIFLSVAACIAAFAALVALLRRNGLSLGLPIAYLGSLLLIHVPGAVAHLLDRDGILTGRAFTQIGIGMTAVGSLCFLAGVWLAQRSTEQPAPRPANRTLFAKYCILAGITGSILAYFFRIPSIGAVITGGSMVWILAVILGLKSSIERHDRTRTWRWVAGLMVYPILMLLLGGFLSYGVSAVIIALSVAVVVARSTARVTVGILIATVLGISIFLSYFENRNAIRGAVWGGADAETRITVSANAVRDFSIFDPRKAFHLQALDARLNQNYYAGLAAARIESGDASYLYGRSLGEGILSLIPRALWPDKPIVAGSGRVVSDMTGLSLSRDTSWGVGNVMEFDINFGIAGLIGGFLLLGWGLGRLDRLAARSAISGEMGRALLFFLPAVALIQPNGSLVDITSGAAGAVVAAYGLKWAWARWPKPTAYRPATGASLARQGR
jgi:hypothetical protein